MGLLPKDERFYDYFDQQIQIIRTAANSLSQGARASSSDSDPAAVAVRIRELESQGDDVLHRLYEHLNKSFITPVDPEDLYALGNALDEVLDRIESTAYKIASYEIHNLAESGTRLVELIDRCSTELATAFDGLKESGFGQRSERITTACVTVNRLESESEDVARRAIHDLFAHEKDPIVLIKMKELYESLESINDRIEDVATLLLNVVVKNS